jgi:hypothetical protein
MKTMMMLFIAMAVAAFAQQASNNELALAESVTSQALDDENGNFQIAGNANKSFASGSQARQKNSSSNLSAQQMLVFFKNENYKLNEEINEISKKIAYNSTSTVAADEVNIMHLTILKNKLEYLEISLQRWLNQSEY